MSFLEQLKQSDLMSQGIFVALTGLVIVFIVLALFFLAIKLMQKASRNKGKKADNG